MTATPDPRMVEITLTRPAGRYAVGDVVTVARPTATYFVAMKWATYTDTEES